MGWSGTRFRQLSWRYLIVRHVMEDCDAEDGNRISVKLSAFIHAIAAATALLFSRSTHRTASKTVLPKTIRCGTPSCESQTRLGMCGSRVLLTPYLVMMRQSLFR